jgi:hypothetical protein
VNEEKIASSVNRGASGVHHAVTSDSLPHKVDWRGQARVRVDVMRVRSCPSAQRFVRLMMGAFRSRIGVQPGDDEWARIAAGTEVSGCVVRGCFPEFIGVCRRRLRHGLLTLIELESLIGTGESWAVGRRVVIERWRDDLTAIAVLLTTETHDHQSPTGRRPLPAT